MRKHWSPTLAPDRRRLDRAQVLAVVASLRRQRDRAKRQQADSPFGRGMAAGYALALRILWRDYVDANV